MKFRTLILFIVLTHSLVAISSTINNKSYYFLKIDDSIGLSESNVKCIIQDRWGFMWFGTKNGLDRYDGNSIRRFDCDDKVRNIGNHNISALYQNSNNELWIGTDKGVFIFNPITEVFTFFNLKTNDGTQIIQWISDIQSDHQGNIWIVAPNQGAFRYNTFTKELRLFATNHKGELSKNNIECMCVRKNGEVWFGTNGIGLFQYESKRNKLKQFINDRNSQSLYGKNIYTICDYYNGLAVGIHEEKLLKYDIRNNILSEVNAPDVHYKIIRSLMWSDNELWVGTNYGLYIINEKNNKVTNIRENFVHPYGLSDNVIFCIYKNKEKDIWLGTQFGGVNYLPNYNLVFDKYVPMNTPTSLSSRRIRDMIEAPNDDIWICTEEGDVNIFTPSTKQFQKLNIPGKKDGKMTMMLNGDNIWIGNFKNGLDIISIKTHSCTHYTPQQLNLLEEGSVFSLNKDPKGNIWLGNGDGLYVSNGKTMKFSRVKELAHQYIYDILPDKKGNIWIATMGNGVYRMDAKSNRWKHFTTQPKNPSGLSSYSISSITEDHKGNLWFATDRGGICMYDAKRAIFVTYSKKEGLPDDVSYKALEDNNHNIWFGTNMGLVRLDPQTHNVRVFKRDNGLLGNHFNYKSATKSRNGVFYFGGIDGLIAFTPNRSVKYNKALKTYVTRLSINNKDIVPTNDNKILGKSIVHTDKIYLSHDQNNISIDFSALYFSNSESTKYTYKMEGIDKDWIFTSRNNATYSQLPPGNYRFMVKEISNDNTRNEITSLEIRIYPPWWLSIYAYIFYLLSIIGILIKAFSWHRQRQQNKILQRQRLFEIQKERELSNAKIEFFTDIAHEIRTPLTLINGSLENIHQDNADENKVAKNLRAIGQNSTRLLELVNQLLDFRKLDENRLQLNFTIVEITTLLKNLVERFEPSLSGLNKEISIEIPCDRIEMPVDKEAFTKILSNLLNNARKYSEKFIRINVIKDTDNLKIQIINDGDKIPKEASKEIFKPFVQLNKSHSVPGSGIGLALARSLAELHNGKLYLETDSPYNSFILVLPYEQKKVINLNLSEEVEGEETAKFSAKDHGEAIYTILIVEDNEEVCNLIAERLSENYRIETAANGKEALKILDKKRIDIIISDIRMPIMDGLALTKEIRANIEYSYVPIILLTAQHDMQNHIEGLKVGADAYIEKPFSFHYLITQIDTLISNRQHERESFKQKPYLTLHSNINKDDENFLEKATNFILENIEDPNFNVEELAANMCMSRSSLHRRIKTILNMSPIDFIRFIKLKKAAELILENKYRTTELCFMVGISSPSYLIKLFQKQYGLTPKEFAKQQSDKNREKK